MAGTISSIDRPCPVWSKNGRVGQNDDLARRALSRPKSALTFPCPSPPSQSAIGASKMDSQPGRREETRAPDLYHVNSWCYWADESHDFGCHDFATGTMSVTRSVVYRVVGRCKTESPQKPVPVHPILAEALAGWREHSSYTKPDDWLFGSKRYRGRKPYWGQAIA